MKKQLLLLTALTLLIAKSHAQPTITDVDGNVYNTVSIGSQLWMMENLRTTKYNYGSPIFYPGTNDIAWENNINGAYAWYGNDSLTYNAYGILYNWFAVSATTNGGKNICPVGWHVPTNSEWNKLEKFLNPATDTNLWGAVGSGVGAALKESGTAHWFTGNTGTNTSGFKAFGGGERSATSGAYSYFTSNGNFWTSTPYGSTAFYRKLQYSSSFIYKYDFSKNSGYSVRAIRDGLITGMNESADSQTISIYPNPSGGSFTISNEKETMTIEIYNLVGELIYKNKIAEQQSIIDLTQEPKGVYFVRITNDDRNIINKKIILQ